MEINLEKSQLEEFGRLKKDFDDKYTTYLEAKFAVEKAYTDFNIFLNKVTAEAHKGDSSKGEK